MSDQELYEYILQHGIISTVKEGIVNYDDCANVLLERIPENERLCPCDQSRKEGIAIMCFMCTGPDLSKYMNSPKEK